MGMKTPDWIFEGHDSKEAYEKTKGIKGKKKSKKEKTFQIKKCPKCKSNDVSVILTGKEGEGSNGWECRKCSWKGEDIIEEELNEDEFMKYLDDKGKEVA